MSPYQNIGMYTGASANTDDTYLLRYLSHFAHMIRFMSKKDVLLRETMIY